MKNNKIYVISDLHMGDRGPRDNFGYTGSNKPQQFSQFLDFVAKQKSELIILGDLFEFWQSPLGKVIMSNIDLLDKIADLDVTFVVGNHDADISAFIGKDMLAHPFFKKMSRQFVRNIGGKEFKFQHGHEVDPFNADEEPSWGRMLAIFAGIFEEKNGSPLLPSGETVEESLEKFGEALLSFWNWAVEKLKSNIRRNAPAPKPKDELTPKQNPSRISGLLEKHRENRKNEKYDFEIMGHTHQAGQFEDWYFNSGSWADENNEFLTISPEGKINFHHWKNNTDVLIDTPIIKP
jgi:UDP-2,3-diacylglucosamine pyrophosphatase LpxH